ncbi:MAG: hypothetical protein IJZ76_05510 [Lachnospiraceae bacterium]|nr:hypothetical protein [Lachnospiraceae bacterium]
MTETQKNTKLNMKNTDWIAVAFLGLCIVTVLALSLFCILCPDNLMHSDTTAEVILSKLLAEEGSLISKEWFYSTEIRIVYSHLIMIPLFHIFSDYSVVKLLSVFIFYILLIFAYYMLAKRFSLDKKWMLLSMALLFAPLSNEYLDMMFIGCFYTSQTICTYLVLSFTMKEKKSKKSYLICGGVLCLAALILGMSGLRYLASLYLPMVLSYAFLAFGEQGGQKKERMIPALFSVLMTGFAGVGFLINKFYLAVNYSFDTTSEVAFVPIAEVPERFLTSLRLMVEFMGYREITVMTPLGLVNPVKCLFLLVFIGIVVWLWKKRMELLNVTERFFLYFFLFLFLINWYMLIFTNVLMQYRYWLPVYVVGVLLVGIFMQKWEPAVSLHKTFAGVFFAVVVLASLYGELWQDVKYNDCEKRYGYMEFLEENGYDFGYATFWNASVTEYLSDGKIKVGNLGGENGEAAPYEWLTPKSYYRAGFHEGKTFLLLARTEEVGMVNGDFTVMEDAVCVYQDEYYAVYEGQQGMYLFSEGYEP